MSITKKLMSFSLALLIAFGVLPACIGIAMLRVTLLREQNTLA